jgi:hypothetical protein
MYSSRPSIVSSFRLHRRKFLPCSLSELRSKMQCKFSRTRETAGDGMSEVFTMLGTGIMMLGLEH